MDETRAVPTGDTVGSYTSYLDAQKAVDYLADQQFPVQMVSIVGNELKMVERVTGRLSYPRVALSGALSGMWFGLFVGVMLSFFAPSPGYFSILTSVLMGAAFFMLFGIVTYAMQRGKRDFTSTSQVVATTYDVVVSPEAAHEARRLLQQLPMSRSDAAAGNGPYTQRDYYNQPYQNNQPHQQPGQGPARPSGWHDPYGQSTGAPAQDPGYQAGDGQQQGRQHGDQAYDGGHRTEQPPAPARPVRYPDLPDGRPQYGVRLPQAPAGEPGQQQGEQRGVAQDPLQRGPVQDKRGQDDSEPHEPVQQSGDTAHGGDGQRPADPRQ